MLPEVGLGLAVAYVRAQQSEQWEVMWGPEQEEGAGAEVRGDGAGGHHKLLDLPNISLSPLSGNSDETRQKAASSIIG